MAKKRIRIIFLGTGPVDRIPRKNCPRLVCIDARKKGSKSRRTQSSIIVQFNKYNILFDITEDILKQWQQVKDIRRLDAVFITHAHRDAMGGISKLGIVLKKLKQARVKLFTEKENILHIKKLYKNTFNFLDIQPIKPGVKIYFDGLRIEGLRIEHTFKKEYPTLGYLIKSANKKIAYISDAKEISKISREKIKKADVLMIDSAMYKRRIPWHMNFQETLSLINKIKPRKAFLTQIGIEWPPYKKAVRLIKKENRNVEIAYDGLQLTI